MAASPDQVRRLIARRGLVDFLKVVTIACRPTPRPFGEVADAWQFDKVLTPLAPAVEYVAGLRDTPPRFKAFWYTLPKGSDKTSVAARCGAWVCNWAPRYTGMAVWAGDRKQAKLLRDAMMDERRLNDWFPADYQIDNYRAQGATGFVEINSSDAAGGHGTRAQIYVVDEISHWKDKPVWDMVASSVTKYDDTILVVLGNAGWKHTWQHELRDQFEREFAQGDTTYFWEPDGIVASWTSRAAVEKARRKISPSEGRRLYDNVWVDAAEDSAWPEEDINGMFCLNDFLELPGLALAHDDD